MAETPKGIATIAKTVPGKYALLLLLDGYPYVEFTTRKSADFMTDLNAWKRKSLAMFARSNVRFFTLAPTGELKELTFTR
jgi:hypothetical protein